MTAQANHFEDLAGAVATLDAPRGYARVSSADDRTAVVEGLAIPVGGWAVVSRADGTAVEGEAAKVDLDRVSLDLLESGNGIAAGVIAEFGGAVPVARLSRKLLGRAVDSLGRPVDGRGPASGGVPALLPCETVVDLRKARRTLVEGAEETLTPRIARAAREHGGPVVALLVGGDAASHEDFRARLGDAASRTAFVVEPGTPRPVRARRAARFAVALAHFLGERERGEKDGKTVLLVADWRSDVRAPLSLELLDKVRSLWSIPAKRGTVPLFGDARPQKGGLSPFSVLIELGPAKEAQA